MPLAFRRHPCGVSKSVFALSSSCPALTVPSSARRKCRTNVRAVRVRSPERAGAPRFVHAATRPSAVAHQALFTCSEALSTMGLMIRHQMGMVPSERAPALQGENRLPVSLYSSQPSGPHHQPPPAPPVQPPGPGPAQAGSSRSPHHQQPPHHQPPPHHQQPPQQAQPPPLASLQKPGPSTGVSAPSAPTSLKRKSAPDSAGPQSHSEQPPAKRVTRRKSKAGGSGGAGAGPG